VAPTETEMVDPRMIKFNAYDGLKLLFQKELNGGIKPAHAPTSFEQLAFFCIEGRVFKACICQAIDCTRLTEY
jgi:hypothetical protein